MIVSFANAGSEDVFYGRNTRFARQTCPERLWRIARRKLDQLDSVAALNELRIPRSIRINDQYRICFVWTASGPAQAEIVDYH